MRVIGIDFDNTLVCYNQPIRLKLQELGLDEKSDHSPKNELKQHLIEGGGNLAWTLFQGELYGREIEKAQPAEGATQAINTLLHSGYDVRIISHRSLFSALGPAYPLHQAAIRFLETRILPEIEPALRDRLSYRFCPSLEKKISEIRDANCHAFIDDLSSVLTHPNFPKNTHRIHYSNSSSIPITRDNWGDIAETIPLLPVQNSPQAPETSELPYKRDSLSVFTELLQTANLSPSSFDPLPGGINNAVYRIETNEGKTVCGKRFRRDPGDSRDRMRNEIEFLEYCKHANIRHVPEVIATDWKNGTAILSFLPGNRWPENKPAPRNLWAQFDSFLQVLQSNTGSEFAKSLPRAAEGARSLQEHLDTLQSRRDFWRLKALENELDDDASKLVLEELESQYQKIAYELVSAPDFKIAFPQAREIITPSDFGLHNALVDSGGTAYFYDFEYAGWDDAAKTLADFDLQPRHSFDRRPLSFPHTHCRDPRIARALELKWEYIKLAKACRNTKP